MKYPWNIYPNLWQNSDFITPQSLDQMASYYGDNWAYFFKNSPLKLSFGVHEIQWNIQQLSNGKININAIECTMPNGQNITYNNQWKMFNGTTFASEDKNIYDLGCNIQDYNNLFNNKPWLELSLIIKKNSFQQDDFIPIASEMEDYLDHYVNVINHRLPILDLIPTILIKDNNYLPLIRIEFKGVYSILEFQYPIIFINGSHLLGKKMEEFCNNLYNKIIYIKKDNNDNNNSNILLFLTILMAYYQNLWSCFKNDNLTPQYWYQQSNILLGQLEVFMNLSNKIYNFYPQDILRTFNEITQRISYIIDNFYQIGTIGLFQLLDDHYYIDINFKWKDNEVYIDFQGNIQKQDLMQWIESSIIDDKDNINNDLMHKTRGMDRKFIDSRITSDNQTWVRYTLNNTVEDNHQLWILNPIHYDLQIKLIKK